MSAGGGWASAAPSEKLVLSPGNPRIPMLSHAPAAALHPTGGTLHSCVWILHAPQLISGAMVMYPIVFITSLMPMTHLGVDDHHGDNGLI